MLSENVPLILWLMTGSVEKVWDDEGFREVVTKSYSFQFVQDKLREIDAAREAENG